MKTELLALYPDWIKTEAIVIDWYDNDQMWELTEMKEGKRHGEVKYYRSYGKILYHRIYENGRLVKVIA